MSAFSTVNPKFELGTTLKGTDGDGNLINDEVLGLVVMFPSWTKVSSLASGARTRQIGSTLKCVALRNTSGTTLYGKRLVQLATTSGLGSVKSFTGYHGPTAAALRVVLLDPFLPSGGVANNDIAWCVLEGVAPGMTPAASGDFNGDISVGAPLVAAGTFGSGSTDHNGAGRVANVTMSNITEAYRMAAGILGYAVSPRTSGETSSEILVQWKIPIF
ncbi:MAG: hypothetical protein NNA30_11520 [Nitrospira sp.]|nr:hypothetical protein [Nitrospira sp.]